MRDSRARLGVLAAVTVASLPGPARAQPVGAEFQVNTYTTDYQGGPAAASDAEGNYVVVWSSGTGQDGDHFGVFGQRYDSGGKPLGGEFRINSYTTGRQGNPDVACASSGDFVVVWDGTGEGDSYFGIFGQRYDSAGRPVGGEFRINTTTEGAGRQEDPSVAVDAAGNFVVVWDCDDGYRRCGVFGQRFDSAGVAQGVEFGIASGSVGQPHVGSDAAGNFVVVYEGSGIRGRRYDADGSPLGAEFQVDQFGGGTPALATDTKGNFVVVWEEFNQDGDAFGVFGRRFDNNGIPQSGQFQINTYTTDWQSGPSVASDAGGNFLVTWDGNEQDGSAFGIFGQRYDAAGAAQGAEFQVNTYTTDTQRKSAVAITGHGDFVVVWTSYYQDAGDDGVFGQRFDFAGDAITIVSPNTEVRWRIGAGERIQWTHNLGSGATFRIELDRDDDGDYEELIAAAAPVDSATKGGFLWTVTGPPSGTVRIRVSWADDPGVSDASDVTFQIRPVGAAQSATASDATSGVRP
jgi:hypothetical protein